MQVGSRFQAICPKCQAPVSQSGGQCPFCGTEVAERSVNDTYPSFEEMRTSIPTIETAHTSVPPKTMPARSKLLPPRRQSKLRLILALAGVSVCVIIIAVVVGIRVLRPGDLQPVVQEVEEEPVVPTSAAPPPPVILGITLQDGPLVDPTDTLHASRQRVAEKKDLSDVRLLGIAVRGAYHAKVNLDDAETSLTYQFLVIHRDARASKAEERRGERVELTLQRISPQTTRMEVSPNTRTPVEPHCVWSAAWAAVVASGLPADGTMDVVYGLDKQHSQGVWTFTTREQRANTRVVDGQTCAIKSARQ